MTDLIMNRRDLTLAERDGTTTTVTFQPSIIKYGNFAPSDMFQLMMQYCTEGDGFCDDTMSGQVTHSTQIWTASNAQPLDATLTLYWSSEYQIGMGGPMVNALAGAADKAKQCQTRSWLDRGATRSGLDGSGTDTFCQSTPEVQIVKSTPGGPTSTMKGWVEMSIDPGQTFDWCSIADLGSAIAGMFGDGAIAAGGFGIASFVCGAATS